MLTRIGSWMGASAFLVVVGYAAMASHGDAANAGGDTRRAGLVGLALFLLAVLIVLRSRDGAKEWRRLKEKDRAERDNQSRRGLANGAARAPCLHELGTMSIALRQGRDTYGG